MKPPGSQTLLQIPSVNGPVTLLSCTLAVTQLLNQDHIMPYRNSLFVTGLLSGPSSRRIGGLLGARHKAHTASPPLGLNGRESVSVSFSAVGHCGLYAINCDHKERQCLLFHLSAIQDFFSVVFFHLL